MPKIVDHDQRRREIVDAYLTVVARSGHRAATSRAVAEEVGVADGALWHYFPTFDAVVQAAANEVGSRTLDRINRSTAGLRGLKRLETLMHEVLPMTKDTRDEAAIVVGFWGRLADGPELSSSTRLAHQWTPQLADALEEAVTDAELRPDTPVAVALDLLRSVTYGQQVAQVVDPETSPEAHERVLEACVDLWRTDRPAGR